MKEQSLPALAAKVLFIPVSCAKGIGEYQRSLIIADEIKRRHPKAQIRFILSRQAPYAKSCPYPCDLLDDTPTKCVKEVNQLISSFLPDLVLFDASGRQAQLKHAYKLGIKVVFLSQHKRKRRRGMKLRRARVTDSHWVVQPHFMIGPIHWWDKFKLTLFNCPEPVVIGPIFTPPDQARQTALLQQYQLTHKQFLLFSAGSGGHRLGKGYAADEFALAASRIYQQTSLACVMIFGDNYPHPLPEYQGVIAIKAMQHADFINLLNAAKAAALSAGDTLLQAIALKQNLLSVAVAKDQHHRLKICQDRHLSLTCDCRSDQIVHGMSELLNKETSAKLQRSLALSGCTNGLDQGILEIERLLA